MGNVFLIRVTLGYQHRAQGTHLPQGYLGNLFARETLPKVLYVSNWYVSLGHVWGSNILKVFPYEGGVVDR